MTASMYTIESAPWLMWVGIAFVTVSMVALVVSIVKHRRAKRSEPDRREV